MHWIKLPSGDRLNLEMPDYVRAGGRIALAGGSFVASDADRAEINRQIDATIAVREEDMAALDGLVREPQVPPPPDPEATFARLKERLADTPSTHLAAGMRRAEGTVLAAVAEQLRGEDLAAEEAGAFVEAVRARLYRQDADTAPLDVPTEVDALGASEVARLDLRQGDDVLNLRYDGIRYCAAIKTRFGDAPAGLPDRYTEISYLDPQDGIWYVKERLGGDAAPPFGENVRRFRWAVARILAHDRDTLGTSS